MNRTLSLLYGLVAYVGFMGWMVYMIGFLGHFSVPKSVNSGAPSSLGVALLINSLIVLLFAVQHTIMARPRFKHWIKRFIPKHLERSTFVLVTDLIMWFLVWQWRPIEGVVWDVQNVFLANSLIGISILGWLVVCLGSFMINHFELLGLEQVWYFFKGATPPKMEFRTWGFYKYVRHPLMLGFLIFFWITPYMTMSHLFFSVLFTIYILIGTKIEEQDLLSYHPDTYGEYMKAVPGLIPFSKGKEKRELVAQNL